MAGWAWVAKADAVAIRDVPSFKEPPGRVRYLTPAEEGRLMTALERRPRMRRVVPAALLSDMRQGEIIGLRREAVDLAAGELVLTKTKSNRVRRVPIADALRPALEEALAASKTGCVFESRRGKPYTENGLRSGWERVRAAAELENFHFHDLRHSCATALRRRGAGLDVIAKVLGHSTLQVTQRYAHVGEGMVRAAVASLPAPAARPPAPAPVLALVR